MCWCVREGVLLSARAAGALVGGCEDTVVNGVRLCIAGVRKRHKITSEKNRCEYYRLKIIKDSSHRA